MEYDRKPARMLWAASFMVGASLVATHAARAASPCSAGSIEALHVPGVTVVSASEVAAVVGTPAYCDVIGQLNTSGVGAPPGSAGFELRLPDQWNRKFLFFGVGGLAGATYADIFDNPVDVAEALGKGYATAITDTGHVGGITDANWALLRPGVPDEAKLADYFYRAVHLVTLAGKDLTARFYGGSIEQAYFDGCSSGGREALVEAIQFADDYDGIIAGDPSDIRFALKVAGFAKQQLTPATYVPATLLPLVESAVNASCGKADGVDDGLIQNPAVCNFNAHSLECTPGQTTQCLSPGQVDTLNQYFTALRTVAGEVVYPGFPISNIASLATGPLAGGGADLWNTGIVPPTSFAAPEPWGNGGFSPAPIAYQFTDHVIQDVITLSPAFNLRSYPVTASGYIGYDTLGHFLAKTAAGSFSDPQGYKRFLESGRKLILYHGYSDPALTPYLTINLYHQLAKLSGGYEPLQRGARLFMVPGMQHCLGGPGPNVLDTLGALEAWVEKGIAPASIIASHYVNDNPAQTMDRTMPLCPFPTEATYAGEGNVNDAANWSCKPNDRLLQRGPNGLRAGLDTR